MHKSYEIVEIFPTPIYTTVLPQELSRIIPFFENQPILKKESGSHNYGERSENSYILEEPECLDLKNYILGQVKEFGDILNYDYETYKFGQSWISLKHPNQSHNPHSHSNSLISGVLFFGENNKDTPAINFHKLQYGINACTILPKFKDSCNSSKYSSLETSIYFTPGLLILFPSHLVHSVPVNTTNITRSSLAFNVIPTVGFGEETNLTELKF